MWLRPKQAAKHAGVSVRTLREWLHRGLKHSRLSGNLVLIRQSDLDAFIEGFAHDENHVDTIVDEACAGLGV